MKLLPMSPVRLLPMSPVHTKGGLGGFRLLPHLNASGIFDKRRLLQTGSLLHDLARAVDDVSRLVRQMDKNKSGHQTQ